MKAAIVLDSWKRRVFERLLYEDGWTFQTSGDEPVLIVVQYEDGELEKLHATVQKCQSAAALGIKN